MSEFYEFLQRLVQRDQLPAFLCGVVFTISLFAVVLPFLRPLFATGMVKLLRANLAEQKARIAQMDQDRRQADLMAGAELTRRAEELASLRATVDLRNQRIESLSDERDALIGASRHHDGKIEAHRERIVQLSSDLEHKSSKGFEQADKLKAERRRVKELKGQVIAYSRQLDGVNNTDGKIWEKPSSGPVPGVPLNQRQTAVISLMNLKGGVGKTTLAANLGAAMAARGLRVLMIDLDHQSSLTQMLTDEQQERDLNRGGRFIDQFFEHPGDLAELRRCVIPVRADIGPGSLHLAPVNERFVDVENRLQGLWVADLAGDVRFRLRTALHSAKLRQHYDVVLIDCPPRWSTGSINALVASDFVLIPVLLERTSADAVPRILTWLRKFQEKCHPSLGVLGVVGNKASSQTKLISREQIIWSDLADRCRAAWGGPVRLFDEVIRKHPEQANQLASLDPKHRGRYESLLDQIRQEAPHAHLEPATVPPLAGAGAGGGGH